MQDDLQYENNVTAHCCKYIQVFALRVYGTQYGQGKKRQKHYLRNVTGFYQIFWFISRIEIKRKDFGICTHEMAQDINATTKSY